MFLIGHNGLRVCGVPIYRDLAERRKHAVETVGKPLILEI